MGYIIYLEGHQCTMLPLYQTYWLSFPIGHLKLLPSRTKQIINVSGIIVLMETALNKDFFFYWKKNTIRACYTYVDYWICLCTEENGKNYAGVDWKPVLLQWFSNLNMHQNHLECFLKILLGLTPDFVLVGLEW